MDKRHMLLQIRGMDVPRQMHWNYTLQELITTENILNQL